jgi:predicted RNA-binding protein YlxR (DUF448 family)
VLSEGAATAGRGAYTCADIACFEQALERGAFARALRSQIRVEPDLARLYTEVSHG